MFRENALCKLYFTSYKLNDTYFLLGNRWILPIWTKTPYRQPPLDLTELEETFAKTPAYEVYGTAEEEDLGIISQERRTDKSGSKEYLELQKRESDL